MKWKTSWNLESLNFTSYSTALKLCDPQARSGKNGLNFKKSHPPLRNHLELDLLDLKFIFLASRKICLFSEHNLNDRFAYQCS